MTLRLEKPLPKGNLHLIPKMDKLEFRRLGYCSGEVGDLLTCCPNLDTKEST